MKNSKTATILTIFFEFVLILTAINSLITGNKKHLFLSVLSMFCMSLPFIITYFANRKDIPLPPGFQIIFVIFIFLAQYLGEILELYSKFWWWDLMLHGISGSCFVAVALYLTKNTIIKNKKITTNRFLIFKAIWALSFTILLGVLWEIFEFIGDLLFKTNMVKGELEDTATDLLSKIIVAFIISIAYYLKNRSTLRI